MGTGILVRSLVRLPELTYGRSRILTASRSYETYAFIDSILYESEVIVENLYLLIETILISSGYIADILLLTAIFGLVHYCFLHPDGPDNPKRGLKGAIYWAHLALCGVLGALYITILGLGINDVVSNIGPSGASYAVAYDGVPTIYKVQVAFNAIYFVAAVEIVAAIGYLIATARKRDLTTKVLQPTSSSGAVLTISQIGVSMMGLIAAPLLIRRVFILAFSAAFDLSLDRYGTPGEYTAEAIIEGITLVLTYAGVVLAFKQLGELSWRPWEGNHQQPQIPVAGYDNPQAHSPPQMGRLYEPNQYQSPHQKGPISPYQIDQASPYDNQTPAHPSHPITMGHNY